MQQFQSLLVSGDKEVSIPARDSKDSTDIVRQAGDYWLGYKFTVTSLLRLPPSPLPLCVGTRTKAGTRTSFGPGPVIGPGLGPGPGPGPET